MQMRVFSVLGHEMKYCRFKLMVLPLVAITCVVHGWLLGISCKEFLAVLALM